ncbi:MAG: hypothetical protein HND51_08550 [Chloroflexi bacterium]|nr:hypothetical protein [Chloroflexota bacterium]
MHKSRYFVLLLGVILAACTAPQPQQAENLSPTMAPTEIEVIIVETETNEENNVETQISTNGSIADVFAAPITAAGEVVIISGQVLDVNGNPLEGAAVEFWQTDLSGVYDHPGDPGTNTRDLGFQFYGTAVTDAEGVYIFRTIQPGRYEPRPPHIHFKVKWNGAELLTSQIYFADVGSEGGTSSGVDTDPLLMSIEQASANDGSVIGLGVFEIVVDTGIGSGSLDLTPRQGEGPYYPVVMVEDYDNDLASTDN